MSFAAKAKKELTMIKSEQCCKQSELAAMIRMNGALQIGRDTMSLDVITENPAIARRIFQLLKELFEVTPELVVRKKMKLKKNNSYIVRLTNRVQDILISLGVLNKGQLFNHGLPKKLIRKNCCKRAYMRGAFLAGGSVNHPEGTSYHLEINQAHQEHSQQLLKLLNEYALNAREIERKKGFVVYIKEGEKITEFLNLIGAHQALLFFEDVRIMKDMRNSVNRLVNCETANLQKTVSAAVKQIENIRYIEERLGLEHLPPKLKELANLRLSYPEISLLELCDLFDVEKITKSGINHRFRKLDEIATRLRNGESI